MVIDEAAGMWLSLFLIWDASVLTILVGFLLFRLFDILKPFPVNLFQTFRVELEFWPMIWQPAC